jgi:hypothetical protein
MAGVRWACAGGVGVSANAIKENAMKKHTLFRLERAKAVAIPFLPCAPILVVFT